MSVTVRKMNWHTKPTPWAENLAQRRRMQAMREHFQAASATLSAAVQNAAFNQAAGMGELAARAALGRTVGRLDVRT